ncbi:MAG: hypothetical protein ABSD31_11295 [Candidatus Binataceae bacterium]|jgi:hypothetical protein
MGASVRRIKIAITKSFGSRLALLTISSVAILYCLGCGQSGGSSGGQVLNATGFYSESSTTTVSYVPDTGGTVSLSSTVSIPAPGSSSGFVGLENMQGTAAIVTSVANLSYSISGSSFSIPNDAFSFSITLPPMTNGVPTLAYAQLQLVSAARMDYLRSNIGFLPPTPFAMTVTVTVQGQSDAGGTFLSNPITYNVTFTD